MSPLAKAAVERRLMAMNAAMGERLTPEHVRRFEAFAIGNGPETTYGELANVIDPACNARGAAVIQGLTVRRRVEIDLRELLTNRTPVRIH